MNGRGESIKQNRISIKQLLTILWAGLLAPAAELLPAVTVRIGGRAAWIGALVAIPIFAGMGLLLWRMCCDGEGLADVCIRTLGNVFGKLILLLYVVWGILLLALRLRLCAQRLMGAGYRDGSMWFLLLTAAGMTLWISWGKLPVVARTLEVLFAVLAVTGLIVVGLALPQVRAENLLPLWSEDVVPALKTSLPTLGVLSYGIYAAFLLGETDRREKAAGRWMQWTVICCGLLALTQMVVIGNFGPALTDKLSSPFFNLAKSIGVKGAFQRVESVIAAIWTFSDLAIASVLLRAIEKGAEQIVPQVKRKVVITATMILCTTVAFIGFQSGIAAELFSRGEVLTVNLAFAMGLPLFISITGWMKRRGWKTTSGVKRYE